MNEFKEFSELKDVAEKRNLSIYSIHFCNAGIGVQFYDWSKSTVNQIYYGSDEWKRNLIIDKYYATVKEAVLAEIKRLS